MRIGRMFTFMVIGCVATALSGPAWASSFSKDLAEDVSIAKRDDEAYGIEAAVDDDDDDLNGATGNTATDNSDGATANTGEASAQTNDNTGSGYSKASRDQDRSRGDRTKDRTRDGGDPTRDRTRNSTNDDSRNDTRG